MLCESSRRHVFELYRWNADQFHDKVLQRLSVFSKKSKELISEHSDLPVMPEGLYRITCKPTAKTHRQDLSCLSTKWYGVYENTVAVCYAESRGFGGFRGVVG